MSHFIEALGRGRRSGDGDTATPGPPFAAAGRPSRSLVADLVWVGQRTDLDHFAGWPPLAWYLQSNRSSDGAQRLALCDPVTGGLIDQPRRPDDLPDTTPLPPELAGAGAVLWVSGTGQSRVSAAVHTVWYAALSRGIDAAVIVGLEPQRHSSTRVGALGLGYRQLETVG
jgi:hypothetical protein